ncbi:MAG TPA: teichoic acid ABC transporter permease [Firmicutes bacterium]|nr:teichoic acid ABC transporter permease [Bacillota bacterium]
MKQKNNIDYAMLLDLSKNDFKVKYAGSYFGVIWAFVQPLIQVLIFWFVFEVGFKSGPVNGYPYVLWLLAGIIPWFFFQEAWTNVTYTFIEYSFLVKKIVFNIDILPLVKIISSTYVHLFFIAVTILIYILNGFYPDVYYVQIPYYFLCTFILVMSLGYLSSALIIFFRDLGQVVNILLQVGVWLTAIMWNINLIPPQYQWLLKLNPLFYIVDGYRNTFINKIWFFEQFGYFIYFWCVLFILLLGCRTVYQKLKPHFSDVL